MYKIKHITLREADELVDEYLTAEQMARLNEKEGTLIGDQRALTYRRRMIEINATLIANDRVHLLRSRRILPPVSMGQLIRTMQGD